MWGIAITFYPRKRKSKKGLRASLGRVSKDNAITEAVQHKIRKGRINKEILGSSICLKNLAIIKTKEAMSTDYLIEQLMENSDLLKPYYMKSLSLYRSGYKNEAYEFMESIYDGKEMRNLVTVLRKLDDMKAEDMIEQINAFNESLMEERVTLNQKRADRNALIFTVLVSMSIFALLLNFSVVVVFMDAINILGSMW